MGNAFFALKRTGLSGESILAVHNVTGTPQTANLPAEFADCPDVITGARVQGKTMELPAYGFAWVKKAL